MSFASRLLAVEPRSVSFQDVWGAGLDWFGGPNAAGMAVTEKTSMQLSAVYGSVRILSEGVSTLPVSVGVNRPPGWVERPSMRQPHLGLVDVLGQVMVSLLLRGNGYVFLYRDEVGRVTELEVLHPDGVKVDRERSGGAQRTVYRLDGMSRPVSAAQVAHVTGMMLPGSDVGMSPLDYAKETIGLGLAAQTFGGGFFGNGANPSGIIEVEESLSQDEASFLRRQFERMHKGANKAQGIAVLTEGAKYRPISVTPEQAQFLATRQFQVSDIARFYGVPPHLLQDASGSTSWGSGLAEQSVNYVTHSLRPWVERIEGLLTRIVRLDYPNAPRVDMSMEHLLRGDTKTRMDAASRGVSNGLLTPNEGRDWIDPRLGPIDGGEVLRAPLNMAPALGGDANAT